MTSELRLPPIRGAHIALVAACVVGVSIVGTLQMIFVLEMEPPPLAYLTPAMVGAVFGTLIMIVWRHREAERAAAQVLAEREDRIRELNASLERLAEQRGHALRVKERELIGAQRMEAVGLMAGGLAHDFNNLLTCVMGSASLLERQLVNDDALDLAREILRASDRAAELTRQLLAVGKRPIARPEVFDLASQLDQLSPMVKRVVGKTVGLSLSLDSDRATILADRGQIEQVVMNLCLNARDAIEATGRGGAIDVSVAVVEDDGRPDDLPDELAGRVVLRVSDDGTGMDADTSARVFEPFFTTKAEGQGTGLGLSVVYGILQMCGADVELESTLGVGTSFVISFPRVEGPVEDRPSDELPVSVTGGKEVVLVVDYDEWVRRLVVAVLRSHGYVVLEAANAEAALERVEEQDASVDLIVTDVMNPDGSGWELAMSLRRIHPALRVLLTTGYHGNSLAAIEMARDRNLLEKPFTANTLARHVRATLDRPH